MEHYLKMIQGMMMVSFFVLGVFLFALNISTHPVQADIVLQPYEMFLKNETDYPVDISVEPIGLIFNELKEHSLQTSGSHNHPYEPITGLTL